MGIFSLFKPKVSKDIAEIDRMNGYEFEQYTGLLLKKLGYRNVVVTQASNDYGIDVTCMKNGVKYAIQCKCYSNKLGNSSVQEAVAGKQYYKCDVGVVLTNNYFTENAINLAKSNGILLWDRTELIKMLQKAKRNPSAVETVPQVLEEPQKEETERKVYDNSNLPVSPYTGLPNSFEINGIDYDLENLKDIECFPQFSTPFSCNNEEYYINTFFRKCAMGYEKNGMINIASALINKAKEFEANSQVLYMQYKKQTDNSILSDDEVNKTLSIKDMVKTISEQEEGESKAKEQAIIDDFCDYILPANDFFESFSEDIKLLIKDPNFTKKPLLSIPIGKDLDNIFFCDIEKATHIKIIGASGSGKSILLHSMIISILSKVKPDEVKLLLIDPKGIEFSKYNGLPHLLVPIVTDSRKAAGALGWVVSEMLQRFKKFSDIGVRDIDSYNEYAFIKEDLESIPRICIFIDEFSLLMMTSPKEVEDSICRLTQMSRAAGIHLIIATMNSSLLKKVNIDTSIELQINGDSEDYNCYNRLLYKSVSKKAKLQGAYVADKDITLICDFIKEQVPVTYDSSVLEEKLAEEQDSYDPLFEKAAEVVIETGIASTSFLQRKLSVSYIRGAKIIDQLEEYGVIGKPEGSKPRQVLMTKQMWLEKRAYDK